MGSRRVDSRDQRLDQPVERLAAHPAADEPRHALLRAVVPAGDEQVHHHPQLAPPREDRRGQERAEPMRRHQHEALGHRHQPPLAHHERPPVARVGLDQPVAQPQPLAEVQSPRLVRDERVRPALQREAVLPLRRDDPADPLPRLQDRQLDRPAQGRGPLVDPVRGRQPREPAADHDHALRLRRVVLNLGQDGSLLHANGHLHDPGAARRRSPPPSEQTAGASRSSPCVRRTARCRYRRDLNRCRASRGLKKIGGTRRNSCWIRLVWPPG